MAAADLTTFFIMIREGLEASLIVGILLAYLKRVGAARHARLVWAGVAAALAVSLAVLGALQVLGAEFDGTTEKIFEGSTMLLATVVLTWMVFWMMRQARVIKGELHRGVDRALASGAGWGLLLLAFFAVVREGVETALLLKAAFLSTGVVTPLGSLAGLAAAIGLGVVMYGFGVRIDLRRFFLVTAVILLLFAAGLASHAAHEFADVGLLPRFVEHLWDTRAILPDDSGLGAILRALFGYSHSPSLLEALVYVSYVAFVVALSRTRFAAALTPSLHAAEKKTAAP